MFNSTNFHSTYYPIFTKFPLTEIFTSVPQLLLAPNPITCLSYNSRWLVKLIQFHQEGSGFTPLLACRKKNRTKSRTWFPNFSFPLGVYVHALACINVKISHYPRIVSSVCMAGGDFYAHPSSLPLVERRSKKRWHEAASPPNWSRETWKNEIAKSSPRAIPPNSPNRNKDVISLVAASQYPRLVT